MKGVAPYTFSIVREAIEPSDRTHLEAALALLAEHGHIPRSGEREVLIRLDEHGRVRWHEARRIRVPASELENTPLSV